MILKMEMGWILFPFLPHPIQYRLKLPFQNSHEHGDYMEYLSRLHLISQMFMELPGILMRVESKEFTRTAFKDTEKMGMFNAPDWD